MFGNGETPQSAGIKGDHLVGKYYVEFDKAYKIQTKVLIEKGVAEKDAEKQSPIMQLAVDMLLKWEAKDPETIQLWKTMNGWVYDGFSSTYKRMGVDFEKLYYESETYLLGKEEVLRLETKIDEWTNGWVVCLSLRWKLLPVVTHFLTSKGRCL